MSTAVAKPAVKRAVVKEPKKRSRNTSRVLAAIALSAAFRYALNLSWAYAAPFAAAVLVVYWQLNRMLTMGLPTKSSPGLLGAVSMSGCSVQ